MAFKVNYNQQRAERDRQKQAKKEEKERIRAEEVARRKAGGEAPAPESDQQEGPREAVASEG